MIDKSRVEEMTIKTTELATGVAVEQAIELANYYGEPGVGALITFVVEDTQVKVRRDSNPVTIVRDIQRVKAGCIEGTVGPYPMSALSAEQLARDEHTTSRPEPANLQAPPSQPGAVQRRSPDPMST